MERTPGAGAAGGLGYGLATFARGELRPGFELLAKTTRLASYLNDCDLVMTGEGSLDASTLMGKGAGSLAMLCRSRKIPVVGLAGIIRESPKLRKLFAHAGALTQLTTPAQARERAAHWLGILAEKTARSVAVGILARRD
jgi:glycerate kinase